MDYTDNGDAGGLPTIDYDEKKHTRWTLVRVR